MKSSSGNGKRQKSHGFRVAALLSVVCLLLLALLVLLVVAGKLRDTTPVAETADILHLHADETPLPTAIPAPTAAPAAEFTFSENAEAPLPYRLERLPLGTVRALDGTIACNYPLTSVSAMLLCDYTEDPFYPYIGRVTFAPGSAVTTYRFTDANTLEGASLTDLIDFSQLKTGLHTLVLSATCTVTGGENAPFTLESGKFYVLGDDWTNMTSAMFSNGSYKTALAFFGKKERFLYRFQRVYDRYTVADPDWEAQYITEIKMDEGEPWRVHIDTLPYYEKVRAYFGSAKVRVHGTNGDTGVLPLSRLVVDYNGSYLSRYTSGLKYFSHHGLGTATDLNAVMPPNENKKENLSVIADEVKNALAYNGILTENGEKYYDFTYSGAYACTDFAMPESVINYLLYEFAFYRAGFQWGHYYNSTSDGMHFTLTDNIKVTHDDQARGLRKVTEYYD